MKYAEWLSQGLALLRDKMNDSLEQGKKKRNYDVMSYEDKRVAIREDLKEAMSDLKMEGYFYVCDLFEDNVIICMDSYEKGNYKSKMLQVPYAVNGNVASFGSPTEVERITSYKSVSEVEQGQEAQQTEVVTWQILTQSDGSPVAPEKLLLTNDFQVIELNQEDLAQAKKGDYSKGLRFKAATLTTFGGKNSQGQIYPKEVWEKNIPQLQEKAKKKMLIGESDHPLNGRPSVDRNSLLLDAPYIQGNKVLGDGKIMATDTGKNLIVQAVEGVPIGVSSRGYGTILIQDYNGERVPVVQDDYVCVTFDAVWSPSSPGSYITGIEQNRQVETEPVQSGNSTPTQEDKIGDENTMNLFQTKVAELRGMIQYAKLQGKDMTSIEQQLEAIVQAMAGSEAGMSEGQVTAILGPIGVQLTPSGQFPADNPSAVESMTRGLSGQSAEAAAKALEQQQAAEAAAKAAATPPAKKELSQAQVKAREAAVQELTAGYDEGTKAIMEGLLEEYETANEILKNAPEVMEQMNKVLGIGRGADTVYFHSTSVGNTKAEVAWEKAPKNAEQAISQLAEGLPDLADNRGKRIMTPDNQKLQFEQFVRNIVQACPHIMNAYLKAEQGRLQLVQSDLGVAADIAVSYAAMLPMIRQAWAKLFLPVVASIQTIDRPEGKIFYLKALTDSEDELNKYHYYDYADQDDEYAEARRVKFKITSDSVVAHTKKLKTTMSYEEIQDARAYHNLDAFAEAISITASEIAREWNNQALYDMMTASGTAGNTDFGKEPPRDGSNELIYSQSEWETQGLKNYLNKVDGDIFNERFGGMTMMLAGPTASLQLEKLGSKFGFLPFTGDGGSDIYAGVNIFGSINTVTKVYKVQIFDEAWGLNKVLCVRKGQSFSDTPYVFAPFTTDIEPPRHGVDGDFSVTQGIMSRAARKVVSPKNLATLTFKAEEGVVI